MNCLHGITNVYASTEARGFNDSGNYPLAWEVVALNNAAGKSFVRKIGTAFNRLNREEGYVLNLDTGEEEPIFSLGCVFRDKAAFLKVVSRCMPDTVIYDENRKAPVFTAMLLGAVEGLMIPIPEAG